MSLTRPCRLALQAHSTLNHHYYYYHLTTSAVLSATVRSHYTIRSACPASPWYLRRQPADCLQDSRGVQVDVRLSRVAWLHNRDRCPTSRRVSATLQALQLLSAWSARLWRAAGRVWRPAVPQDFEQSLSHTARTPPTAVRNIASLPPQKTHTR